MAVIQNIINTLFSTSGDRDVENAANRVGRAQTRMGQASTAAGREFAAQSQGLGGLVGAYAGAAATTFALGAAFDALARSARALQTLEGLDAIAAGAVQSGNQLLQSVSDITKGQLTITEAAQQINLSLSAGFDTAQIEGLADVALRASRALGRDLTDSMTRVTRGSAKMETELLDELGIYTKIDPATRAYAAALDKSVSSLTEYERRQAFVNSVIDEGQRKYQNINVVIPTAAEKIEAFGVTLTNLATKLGGFLAEVLAPLADAINNNVAAAFATLGIVLGLVGGKAVEVFTGAIDRLAMKAINAGLNAENLGRKILGLSASAQTATNALLKLNTATVKLNDTDKEQLKTLQASAEERKLSQSELKKSEELIKRSIANTERETISQSNLRDSYLRNINVAGANLQQKRAEFEQNKQTLRQLQQQGAGLSQLTAAQTAVRQSQGALGAATRAFNVAQAQNVTALNAARTATLNLNADLVVLRSTLLSVRSSTTAAGAGLLGFAASLGAASGKIIGNLGKFASGFASLAASAFFWISILQLLGTTIANVLGKGDEYNAFFTEIGKSIKGLVTNNDVKEYRKTLTGLVGASLADIENVNKRLAEVESFTFRKKSVLGVTIEIEKTKEDIVKEATAIIEEASQPIQKSFSDSITSGTALGFAGIGAIAGSFFTPIGTAVGAAIGGAIGAGIDFAFGEDEAKRLEEAYASGITDRFSKELAGLPDEARRIAVLSLAKIEDTYKDIALIDPGARLAKEASELVVLDTLKTAPFIDAITTIRKATSASFADIKDNFDFTNVERDIQGVSFRLTETLANIGKGVSFTFLTKEAENAISAIDLGAAIDTEGLKSKLTKNIGVNAAEDFVNNIKTVLTNDLSSLDRILSSGFTSYAGDYVSPDVLKEFIGVQAAFDDLILAQGILEQTSLQLVDVVTRTNTEFANGSIDVERYGQNIGSIETALRRSVGEIAAAQAELQKLSSEGIQSDEVKANIALLESLIAQRVQVIELAREELKLIKAKQPLLEAQQKVSKFIDSIGAKSRSVLDIELQLDTAQLGDELAAQELALRKIISATNEYSLAFDDVKTGLKTLSSDVIGKILASPVENIDSLVTSLNSMEGVSAKASDGILTVREATEDTSGSVKMAIVDLNNYNAATLRGNAYNQDAREKLKNLGYEALSKSISKAADDLTMLNKIIKETNEEVTTLQQEDSIAALKFSIDIDSINAQLASAAREGAIEKLELQADLVGTKVANDQLTALQGAILESQIQQEILAERKKLLEDEQAAIEANRAKQLQLLELERGFAIQAAQEEALGRFEQIQAARDNADNLIDIYRNLIAQEEEVNNNLLIGFTGAGNELNAALAETLENGASSLNKAIALGLSKVTEGDFSVEAGGLGDSLTSVAEDRFTDVVTSVNATADRATMAVASNLGAVIKSIQDRFNEQERLITAEASSAAADVTRNIENLDLEGTIETADNIRRIFDAIDTDMSKSVEQVAKDFDRLNEIVKEAEQSIVELANQEIIAKIEFDIDSAALDQQLQELVSQDRLRKLQLEIDLVNAKVGSGALTKTEGAVQENALQQQILAERRNILNQELEAIRENNQRQVALLEAQRQLDIAAAIRDANLLQNEIQAAQDNATNLINIFKTNILAQEQVNQALVTGIVSAGNKFTQALASTFQSAAAAINQAALAGAAGDPAAPGVTPGVVESVTLEQAGAEFTEIVNTVINQADAASIAVGEALGEQLKSINTAADRAIELENKKAGIATTRAEQEIENLTKLGEIEAENAKSRLANAEKGGKKGGKKGKDEKTEAELLGERTRDTLLALFDGIQGALNTAITDFGNLILYGEGNIGDIFSNLFKSIQQTVFQETIAKPFSNFLTESLFKQTRRGIENAKVDANGALLVKVSGGIDALVSGPLKGQEPSKETGKTFLEGLTKEGGFFDGIKNFFSSLFSKDGFFGQIFSTIGSLFSGGGAGGGGILSSIFSGIASILGFASGGTVHRAGGGAIPSIMARDRVNAMLEPGEFVIRKPMARQIGTPALQQMNATGKGVGGDVQVNINNQGTPQQAQASSPRFDGEKYVIDIITRDLANNGPIRRSLRGDR